MIYLRVRLALFGLFYLSRSRHHRLDAVFSPHRRFDLRIEPIGVDAVCWVCYQSLGDSLARE